MHTVDHPRPSRQRGPHNDPSMLDGDSAHGNPGEPAGDEWAVDTDTDVVDQGADDALDDAVADPMPETEDEIDEFEAGAATELRPPLPPAVEQETDEEKVESGEVGEELEDESTAEPTRVAEISPLELEVERQLDPTPDVTSVASFPPIDGYDALTVPQVLESAEGMEVRQLNAILEYERANRNRKTLVAKLTRLTAS